MSEKTYINLHNHTHGSLLDGASRPLIYAEKVKSDGGPAMVSTDHGNLHTVLDMKEAAEQVGIKYMPGQEFYQARKSRFDRDPEESSGKATSEWEQRGPYHLTVIATNNVGYSNLIKLSSRAYTEGLFVKPRIDHELLSQHSEGLVILSGCLSGEIQQALLRDDVANAYQLAATMQEIVGKDRYFIEVMNHQVPEELQVMPQLIEIAGKIGAPIVATCDSHYTHKEDAGFHDVSLCISTGSKLSDEKRFKFPGDHFYLKSYSEMAKIFPEEYLDNTMLVYDKYDLNISYSEYHFPIYNLPQGITEDQFLITATYEGAAKRYGTDWRDNQELSDRIAYELNVIRQLGFTNYFLVVSDLVKWAKNGDIIMGPARGSASGSVVAYCLYITEVEPIRDGLVFERFLVYDPPEYELDFPEVA